jgi:hypothetical protein
MPQIGICQKLCISIATAMILGGYSSAPQSAPATKIGVLYVVHGGFDEYTDAALWDSTLQIFAHDSNSIVYKNVLWNPPLWPQVLSFGNAPKEIGKYSFELQRIGGRDPPMDIIKDQLKDLRKALKKQQRELGVVFVTDYVSWINPDPSHLADPRRIYQSPTNPDIQMTWCGQKPESGWRRCNTERYNVDGSVERLLNAGVSQIIAIDLTTSGVRFAKTFDVIREARALLDRYNDREGTQVKLHWLNDPTDLMTESYPVEPVDWTYSLGNPVRDISVPLAGRPNPVAEDPLLAAVQVRGIVDQFNPQVSPAKTGVMLVNHSLRDHNQYFDPKVDDTVILNNNIKAQLLEQYPEMQAENIVGGWMGIKQINPDIVPTPRSPSQLERTRAMRGENLGHAWLYETAEELPGGDWQYRYWEALERLRAQGVEHIVVAFPQIMVDSVLNMVELPNQVGKELGYKNWLYIEQPNYRTYPKVGHPFADYWGIWVAQICPVDNDPEQLCCFRMGGCSDGRPYPPPRQTPITKARNDLDPSLAYDVSAYGHLGYNPANGKPNDNAPVQNQYRGTWAMWTPPNDDPRVIELLSSQIIEYLVSETPQQETSVVSQ